MTTITLSEGITLTATKATIEKVEEAKRLFDHYHELSNNGCPEELKNLDTYLTRQTTCLDLQIGLILNKVRSLVGAWQQKPTTFYLGRQYGHISGEKSNRTTCLW